MSTLLALIGIGLSVTMVIFREAIGDMTGEADWMRKVGGVYYVVVYAAVFIFFWSISTLVGTNEIFLAPVRWLIPWQPAPPPLPDGSF